MRILHVCTGNMYGGVEVAISALARNRGLAPGLDQRFAPCFEGRLAGELRGAGITPRVFGPARFSRPWTLLRARRALREILAEEGPEAVVCHASWIHALAAGEARRSGAALVHWQHDMMAGPPAAGGAPRPSWTERRAARTPPDLVLVNSRATAETTGAVFPGARVEVIYYPVEPPPRADDREALRREVRSDLGTPGSAVVIAMTCRLESYKGHSLLIEALGRLRDRPGWVAWVAGGVQRDEDRAYLDGLIAAAGAAGIAGRVKFLGQRSDVRRLLAAADIHCQPNLGPEPFGIAFVEALDAALPVVTTALGGAVEVVDSTCGVLVPPGDPEGLAGALAGLIDDPARRAALGAAGPERARALCDPAARLGDLQTLLGAVRPRAAAAPA